MINRLLFTISILLISFIASAQLQVISPNGGEVWQNGPADNHVIFEYSGDGDYFKVYYSPDGGNQWLSVAYGHGITGINDIVIYADLPASDNGIIKVEDYNNPSLYDISDSIFTVEDVTYFVYYPEEHDIYYHGEQIYLQWTSPNNNPVNIDFSDNNGVSWTSVVTGYTSYYYTLQAPIVNSNNCFIRISDATNEDVFSLSAMFSVLSPPQITVLHPNGGEVWTYGQSYPVSWSGINLGPYVAVKISTDGGNTWLNYGEAATSPTGGSTEIDAPWIGTSEARVKIVDYYYGGEGDISDNNFTVLVPDYIVYHPYLSSTYYTNEPFSVDWHAAFETETDIAISVDNGVTFETVINNVPAGQTYAYLTAPSTPASHCIIKVSNSNDPSSFGLSPVFSVLQSPQFTMLFPNGSEVLDNDSTYTISWDYSGDLPGWSYVQVEFSADSGLNWTSIGFLDEGNTSLEWTTPLETSSNCLIRVKDPYSSYINDVTDETFAIEEYPELEICIVSVDSTSGKNIVTWNNVPVSIISEYVIMKEGNATDLYFEVGNTSAGESMFIDQSSNPDERAGRYKLTFRDAAGNLYQAGDFHETMHLSISKGINDEVWNLAWNPYIGKPVTSYNIYRGTSRNEMAMIATISGNFTTFTDLNAPNGDVYYMVELIINDECESSKDHASINGSRSNIATNNSLGIDENSSNQIVIYPNPAKDIIRIGGVPGDMIRIYTLEGIQVMSQKHTGDDIDITRLNPGIYFIEMGNRAGRFIKLSNH